MKEKETGRPIIYPKGEYELTEEFRMRLQAAKNSRFTIPPKGKNENSAEFQMRLRAAQEE